MASNALNIIDSSIKHENQLTSYNLLPHEEEWILSAANYHSYFELELNMDNSIRNAYFMDASEADEISNEDKKTYNFERRLNDNGVKRIKIKKKKFNKFWFKYLVLSFDGLDGIEYVKNKKFTKIYRCRPFGWAIQAIQEDSYGY